MSNDLRVEPTNGRSPHGPTLESTLRAEVSHCTERLAAAQRDLRNYLLSHGADAKPLQAAEGTNGERGKVHHG